MCCSYMLRVSECVFLSFFLSLFLKTQPNHWTVLLYSSFVCISAFAYIFKIQGPLRECRSIRPGAFGIPYYCAPLVCVPDLIGLPAVWRHNKPKPKPSRQVKWRYWRDFFGMFSQKMETFSLHEVRTLLHDASSTSHAVSDFEVFFLAHCHVFASVGWTVLQCSQVGSRSEVASF